MKRYKLLYSSLFALLIAGTSLTSCKDYLDVNDNPNYPVTTTMSALLPSACASTISQLGLYGDLMGDMWLQFTTQGNTTNQYNTLCNYSLTVTSYNGFFTNAYTNTLPDLKDVIAMAEQEEAWDYWVIAKVLTAYNYHMLADLYEDIPFTEALDQEKYPYPHYDDGRTVVYPGILSLLQEAIDKCPQAAEKSSSYIDTYDMFLEGDINKWRKFAKNLKLKVLVRDFDANKQAIQALLDENDFLEDDCAFTKFEDATDKGNPLYEYNIRQLNTKVNIRACHTLVEYLLHYDDPRIANLYEVTAASNGEGDNSDIYEGLPCGSKPQTSTIALVESSAYTQAYDDPVYLMNKAEIFFLEAEAYARLGNVSAAKEKYDNGVKAAFDRWESTTGMGDAFVAAGGAYAFDATSEETMMKCIMTQKWISYAHANALDGVFDRNRTGIPAISTAATVRVSDVALQRDLTPGYELGTLVAPGSSVLQPTDFPRRLLIPSRSSQYNPNAPVTKNLEEPMWWQVERGK